MNEIEDIREPKYMSKYVCFHVQRFNISFHKPAYPPALLRTNVGM